VFLIGSLAFFIALFSPSPFQHSKGGFSRYVEVSVLLAGGFRLLSFAPTAFYDALFEGKGSFLDVLVAMQPVSI